MYTNFETNNFYSDNMKKYAIQHIESKISDKFTNIIKTHKMSDGL